MGLDVQHVAVALCVQHATTQRQLFQEECVTVQLEITLQAVPVHPVALAAQFARAQQLAPPVMMPQRQYQQELALARLLNFYLRIHALLVEPVAHHALV